MTVWLHTHLPRLRAGERDVVSVKVPGQRVEYARWVSLRNAEFRVHERDRLRCVREGVRNVHAWVVGEEVLRLSADELGPVDPAPPTGYRRAVYDPFRGGSFVDLETLEPVTVAALVIQSGKDVWYAGYEARVDACRCGRFEGESMPDSHSIAVCCV